MGLATAEALGAFGPVLVAGRSEKRLRSALEQLEGAGVTAYGKPCDVSDRASVAELCAYARTLGDIGSVVNAAGVDFDNSSIEQIVSINMLGVINVTEEFLPYLQDAVMVHYSSITGYYYPPQSEDLAAWNDPNAADFCERCRAAVAKPAGTPDNLDERFPYYAASKRFVMHYTMANARRFGKANNRIFSIAPGAFETPMFESGVGAATRDETARKTAFNRIGDPREMADLIVSLMKPGHDYFTGCDVVMDGGKNAMTLVPQLA